MLMFAVVPQLNGYTGMLQTQQLLALFGRQLRQKRANNVFSQRRRTGNGRLRNGAIQNFQVGLSLGHTLDGRITYQTDERQLITRQFVDGLRIKQFGQILFIRIDTFVHKRFGVVQHTITVYSQHIIILSMLQYFDIEALLQTPVLPIGNGNICSPD